jgi:Tfp pilus assembly ATPase PilU
MRTFDESLAELYLWRQISKEEAIANARDKTRFENLLRVQTDKKQASFGEEAFSSCSLRAL